MIGRNQMKLNGATVAKAIEEYLNEKMSSQDDHIIVASVKEDRASMETWFIVCVDAKDVK